MPSRFVTAAAVALAVACPAYADTNVTVRGPTYDQVDDTAVEPDAFRVGEVANGRVVKTKIEEKRITLTVAGSSFFGVAVDVPLALARGTRVTGMTVTIANETVRAELLGAYAGHDRYFDIVQRQIDPALLEHTMTTSTSELLTLRVYPLTVKQHATVTLELGIGDAAAVDEDRSLFAAGNATAPGMMRVPTVIIGCAHQTRYMDKASIRRVVKIAMPRLRHCYTRELLHDHELAGTATIHFTIGRDGKVAAASADGDLDSEAAKQCIADDVKTWEFSPSDETIQVNYPLNFRIAGT